MLLSSNPERKLNKNQKDGSSRFFVIIKFMNKLEEIANFARKIHSGSNDGHGFDHIERVVNLAQKILLTEPSAEVPGCRGSNLAIVSLSTSCQISINTFPSGKPSSSCASVYLFRPITNTSKPPPMPINLLNLSPSIPAHIYALSQIKSISRSRSNRDTFIWPCY